MKKRIHILTARNIFMLLLFFLFSQNVSAEMDHVRIQGFVSQGYLKSTANNFYANTEEGTFEFNEIGINFTTQASDKLHLGIQFFARDLGRLDNDEPQINWAYGDYRLRDYLGIRAGIMKLSFGLYNEIRDMDLLRPNILYSYGVYNESWRSVLSSVTGIGLYGNMPIGPFGKLKYVVQDGVNSIHADSGASDLLEDQVTVNELLREYSADVKKVHVDHFHNVTLFWEAPFSVEGLKIGISGFDVYFEATTALTHASGSSFETVLSVDAKSILYSLEYTIGDFIFSTEYVIYTWNLMLANVPVPEYDSSGYYFNLAYSPTEQIEVFTGYSVYYGNDDDKEGKRSVTGQEFRGWLKESIIGIRFDLNDNWFLKFETHFNDGAAILLDMDQGEPELNEEKGFLRYPYKKEWILFAAKISYHF